MSCEWLTRILYVRETEVQEVFHIVRGTRILLRVVTVLVFLTGSVVLLRAEPDWRGLPEKVDSDWTEWYRPVEEPVFTTAHGNNHDSILFVDMDEEYPYKLIVSHEPSHAYLWRTKHFSWSSVNWELVSKKYNIAGHYEYDDGVKVNGTYYIYEVGNVYTYSGSLEDADGNWKKRGTFPDQIDDIGVYHENGVFHVFGEYGEFPHGPDGTSLAHFRSDSGFGNWELVDKKAVDPNPDGGRKYGTGDPTIAKIEGSYYIYCDLEMKGTPYRIMGWKSSDINEPFTFLGILMTPRSDQTANWDNYRVQDPDIGYIPDLNRYVMVCNMKDHDGVPGNMKDFPNLGDGNTRVNGWFYSRKTIGEQSSGQ